MKKGKKILMAVGCVLLALVLLAGIGAYAMFHNELRVIATIQKLNGENLYSMEYAGDYGVDDLLLAGGVSSSEELAAFISNRISKGFYTYELPESDFGCSTISAVNAAGQQVFGRNFDWDDCTTMVVTTLPENGYKSISTVNLDFLGYNSEFQPEGLLNSFLTLAAPLAPLDGMNEMGLCVADLVVGGLPPTQQNTGKIDITTTLAIRLILDRAATVQEAIDLLTQYDMHSDIGSMHHIAITDRTGRSVVVEYLDDVMVVTDTDIVTNFIMAQGSYYGIGSDESKMRYDILSGFYEERAGVMELNDIKNALMAVAQSSGGFDSGWATPWSIVYNQTTLELTLYHYENYNEGYVFSI